MQFMPGLGGLFGSADAWEFIASSSGTSANLAVPSSGIGGPVLPGDIAIHGQRRSNSASTPSADAPAGWTSILNAAGADSRVQAMGKVLVLADIGAVFTTIPGNVVTDKVCVVLRRSAGGVLTSAGLVGGVTGSDPPDYTILGGSAGAPAVSFGLQACYSGAMTGQAFSPAGSVIAPSTGMAFSWRIEEAPQNTLIQLGDSSQANFNYGFYIT